MAYVIAEPCIGTKDTACVDVCPVDCIHPAKNREYHGGPESQGSKNFDEVPQLYIHPDGVSLDIRQWRRMGGNGRELAW